MRYSNVQFFVLGLLPVVCFVISNIIQLVRRDDAVVWSENVWESIVLSILLLTTAIKIWLEATEYGKAPIGLAAMTIIFFGVPSTSAILTLAGRRSPAIAAVSLTMNLLVFIWMLPSLVKRMSTQSQQITP